MQQQICIFHVNNVLLPNSGWKVPAGMIDVNNEDSLDNSRFPDSRITTEAADETAAIPNLLNQL
jgi:hypothetical protein